MVTAKIIRRARETLQVHRFGEVYIASQARVAERFGVGRGAYGRRERDVPDELYRYAMIGLLAVEGLDPKAVPGLWPKLRERTPLFDWDEE